MRALLQPEVKMTALEVSVRATEFEGQPAELRLNRQKAATTIADAASPKGEPPIEEFEHDLDSSSLTSGPSFLMFNTPALQVKSRGTDQLESSPPAQASTAHASAPAESSGITSAHVGPNGADMRLSTYFQVRRITELLFLIAQVDHAPTT